MNNIYSLLSKINTFGANSDKKGGDSILKDDIFEPQKEEDYIIAQDQFEENKEDKSFLVNKFPSLALPDVNKEELEIQLDNFLPSLTEPHFKKPNDKKSDEKGKDNGLEKEEIEEKRKYSEGERNRSSTRESEMSGSRDIRDRRDLGRERDRYRERRDRDRHHSYSHRDRERNRDREGDRSHKPVRDRKERKERSKSRSRSGSFEDRRRSKSYRDHDKRRQAEPELEVGDIHEGIVLKVERYGGFVKIAHSSKEGLVHISEIDRTKRIKNISEALIEGMKVFVKVISIAKTQTRKSRITLSMKDVNQETGEELPSNRRKMWREGDDRYKRDDDFEEIKTNPSNPLYERKGGLFPGLGALTGIKLDNEVEHTGRKKRISSPELWELSRLKGGQVNDLTDEIDFDEQTGGLVFQDLDEECAEVELNEDEPPFLKGQTTKTGIALSPIKIVKAPEGSLQRGALRQSQLAKERKERRDQQQRAVIDSTLPNQMSKIWNDPSSDTSKTHFFNSVNTFSQSVNHLPKITKPKSSFTKCLTGEERPL